MKRPILIITCILAFQVALYAQKTKPLKTATPEIEHIVLISTDLGDIKIKLYNATPQHRDNFIKLVKEGFYDSLLFHRVIKQFMIQGGDPESKNAPQGKMLGNGDVGYTIPAEFVDSLFHRKGALCAARTENPAKASSGCQFYIVQGQSYTTEQINTMEMQMGTKFSEAQKKVYSTIGGTPFLDHNYTVFGEVIQGMEVIDKIASVKTAPGDRPVTDVHMKMKLIQ